MQGIAVTVINIAFGERFAGGAQFVTGREERHAQAALHGYFHEPERRKQSQFRWHEFLPGREHDPPFRKVFSRLAHVLTGTVAGTDAYDVAVAFRALLHDDGIGSRRHFRPGHDAYAFAWPNYTGKRPAGPGGADNA